MSRGPSVPFRVPLISVLAVVLLAACDKEVPAPRGGAQPMAEPGVLHIATEPGGAQLFIDGRNEGTTPEEEGGVFAIRLPEGSYVLEARKPVDEFSELVGRRVHRHPADEATTVVVLRLEHRLTEAGEVRLAEHREWLEAREKALIARFVDNDDGTVTDSETGLVWMRCAAGQSWDGRTCQGEARRFTWGQATKFAAEFSHAGNDGWRLPTREELHGLTYCSSGQRHTFNADGEGGGCAGDFARPTILEAVFPNSPAVNFWSSTPHERYSYRAWGVAFAIGYMGAGAVGDYDRVRLVRDPG